MAKVLSRRLLPPDDPMFSSGLETFSLQRSTRSTKSLGKSTVGMKGANLSNSSSPMEDEELATLAESKRRYQVRQQTATARQRASSKSRKSKPDATE